MLEAIRTLPLVCPGVLSWDLRALLRAMLDKDPEKRFAIADVLASDWLKGTGPGAPHRCLSQVMHVSPNPRVVVRPNKSAPSGLVPLSRRRLSPCWESVNQQSFL
jgi:serine/threonine protein kinase